MTHDERTSLIKKILYLALFAIIGTTVWFHPKFNRSLTLGSLSPKKSLAKKADPLEIIQHHLPGDPASEQLALNLSKIQKKYGSQVHVTQVDITQHPEISKSQGITKAPHVVILARKKRVFDFDGLWDQAKLEYKVDEILHGLESVGKDWRPVVPGMTPAGI